MKRSGLLGTLTVLALGAVAPAFVHAADWTVGMQQGKPAIQSIGSLAFGPEGILFVGDTKSASVFAVATGDTAAPQGAKAMKVDQLKEKLAGLLGTTPDQVLLNSLTVNPVSKSVYLSVSRGRGPDALPVLAKVTSAGALEVVKLDSVKYSVAALPDAPADAGGRGQSPRRESITDLVFLEDSLIVAGLSNEEFSSTLHTIPFPFKSVTKGTGVEMYHGSHGRFETRSPVRTLIPFKVGNENVILAAYTCTPLVEFALKELVPGGKVKGKTIAELGAGNRPIDMIAYQKDGKDYLLLANDRRGVMKVSTQGIESAEKIESHVSGTAGMKMETIKDWTGIDHLDRLDAQNAVVLRHDAAGAVSLQSLPLP